MHDLLRQGLVRFGFVVDIMCGSSGHVMFGAKGNAGPGSAHSVRRLQSTPRPQPRMHSACHRVLCDARQIRLAPSRIGAGCRKGSASKSGTPRPASRPRLPAFVRNRVAGARRRKGCVRFASGQPTGTLADEAG
ncbi:hypothetical protein BDY21DRAFT_145784 [Lineolata rhizophorae]|uniref:Uncharacterized protein n=1 Tax=Lineolata rhizophorae TaxID=578093 RepID=A0A6A6NNU4_9PEZI|nr:hypothetical protein BDY21DRAFT_145784 [Lineolata rhizophorae]